MSLQSSCIGSGNILAPSRRQAIVWTNAGQITDPYLRRSASMSFKMENNHLGVI